MARSKRAETIFYIDGFDWSDLTEEELTEVLHEAIEKLTNFKSDEYVPHALTVEELDEMVDWLGGGIYGRYEENN